MGGRSDSIEDASVGDAGIGGDPGGPSRGSESAAGRPGRSFQGMALDATRGAGLKASGGTSRTRSFGWHSCSPRRSQHKRSPSSQTRSALIVPAPLLVTRMMSGSLAMTGAASGGRRRGSSKTMTARGLMRPSLSTQEGRASKRRCDWCARDDGPQRTHRGVQLEPNLLLATGFVKADRRSLNRRTARAGGPGRRRCGMGGWE
jgi:hypothetical protein